MADTQTTLLIRARRGDRAAYEEAVRPHLPMLLAYSRAICGDFHRAEDVVQETALIGFRNLRHLFPEADFSTWLRAIARRQALAARRKASKLRPVILESLERAYAEPDESERMGALRFCLETLEKRPAALVRGHYFERLKLTELAARMKLKLNSVKTILFRSREFLEKCVTKRVAEAKP